MGKGKNGGRWKGLGVQLELETCHDTHVSDRGAGAVRVLPTQRERHRLEGSGHGRPSDAAHCGCLDTHGSMELTEQSGRRWHSEARCRRKGAEAPGDEIFWGGQDSEKRTWDGTLGATSYSRRD